jgi:N-carbamoylputrescine amidase
VLAGNRIGHEPDPTGSSPGIDFWGSSFVAGPQGEVLALASTDQEQVLIADIDRARTENVRRIWPYLRDRRIDAYQDLLRLYRD